MNNPNHPAVTGFKPEDHCSALHVWLVVLEASRRMWRRNETGQGQQRPPNANVEERLCRGSLIKRLVAGIAKNMNVI